MPRACSASVRARAEGLHRRRRPTRAGVGDEIRDADRQYPSHNYLFFRSNGLGVGVEVIIANNGREALSLLHEVQDVDLVLMDCLMPVMDGLAATRAIRFDKRLSKLPVLALTANVLPDDIAMCRGAGMNDHIGKPFQAQDLYDMLDRWLPTPCANAQREQQ